MKSATTSSPTSVSYGWMRAVLLASCFALLAAAAPSRGVDATPAGNIQGAAGA